MQRLTPEQTRRIEDDLSKFNASFSDLSFNDPDAVRKVRVVGEFTPICEVDAEKRAIDHQRSKNFLMRVGIFAAAVLLPLTLVDAQHTDFGTGVTERALVDSAAVFDGINGFGSEPIQIGWQKLQDILREGKQPRVPIVEKDTVACTARFKEGYAGIDFSFDRSSKEVSVKLHVIKTSGGEGYESLEFVYIVTHDEADRIATNGIAEEITNLNDVNTLQTRMVSRTYAGMPYGTEQAFTAKPGYISYTKQSLVMLQQTSLVTESIPIVAPVSVMSWYDLTHFSLSKQRDFSNRFYEVLGSGGEDSRCDYR